MTRRPSFRVSLRLLPLLVLLGSSDSAAQEQAPANATVRVTSDAAPLWRRNPSMMVATAKSGTILEVVGRERQWLQVIVPSELGGHAGETAFIWMGLVQLESGTLPSESLYQAPPGAPPSIARAGGGRRSGILWRGIGQAAYDLFRADESFDAIFEERTGWLYGGGVQVVFPAGLFAEFTVDYLEKTGERAFVSGTEVFPLGIRDQLRIVPLQFTAGYRVQGLGRLVPYGGGGGGVLFLYEESDFEESGERVEDHFGSFHVLGGLEIRGSDWASTAFEVQWSRVPDSIGVGGVSSVFGEDDLGGVSIRVKVLIGK